MNPHIRGNVHEEDGLPADDTSCKIDGVGDKAQAKISGGDVNSLAGAEDVTGGLKVAHAQQAVALALLALGAGRNVEEQIHLPPGNLVEEEFDQGDDGGVLEQLGIEVQVGDAALAPLRHVAGDKDHVLLHVAGEAVVAVVRELPAEIGDEEERVGEPSHDVVDHLVGGESTVAALVGQDPETGAEQALDEAVADPHSSLQSRVLDLWDVSQARPRPGRDQDQVASQVSERSGIRLLEALGGDGVPDGLDIGVYGASLGFAALLNGRRRSQFQLGFGGLALSRLTSGDRRGHPRGRHVVDGVLDTENWVP